MTQSNSNDTHARIEWNEVHSIRVETVVVTVKKSSHRKPRYSLDVCFLGNTRPEAVRWYNVQYSGEGNQLKITPVSEAAHRALIEAESWVQEAMITDYWDFRNELDIRRAELDKKKKGLVGTHALGKGTGKETKAT